MERRRFLQGIAAGAVALRGFASPGEDPGPSPVPRGDLRGALKAGETSVEGHTLLCTFSREAVNWKVYEDLRTRDGAITFLSSAGSARVLPKSGEATFAEDGPQHLGLDLKDIGLATAICWPTSCWPTAIPRKRKCDGRRLRWIPPHHGDSAIGLRGIRSWAPRVQRHDAGLSPGQHAHVHLLSTSGNSISRGRRSGMRD